MKKLSLKMRIIIQALVISLIVPLVAFFIVYRNNQTANVYRDIANNSLARMDKLGEMLANFRQVRVEVRSLGLVNNTAKDAEKYVAATKSAIEAFEKSKSEFEALLRTDKEKEEFAQMDVAWTNFLDFGKGLLILAKKGDSESFNQLAEDVRVICPVKKEEVEKRIRKFIKNQKTDSKALVAAAQESEQTTKSFALAGTLAGFLAAMLVGAWFASKIGHALTLNIEALGNSVAEINNKSQETADVSTKISSASVQQASSLQETVASIDEIAAMISRNADSAGSAAATSEITNNSAKIGKAKIEEMLISIKEISSGNDEINNQILKSNKEISAIVNVIQEISDKTKVINDIVFQTKLLSFNASVESARAGEHGKGFAVVADEVGNLARMSGQAANEISDLLEKSTKTVTSIVDTTKNLMEKLISESKVKISIGTKTANDCALALDEILENVSSMSQMVGEISVASKEQAAGVREINKAMTDLDLVTQTNTEVAQNSSETAGDLKKEADKLATIVAELTTLVQGAKETKQASQSDMGKVVQLKINSKNISILQDQRGYKEG